MHCTKAEGRVQKHGVRRKAVLLPRCAYSIKFKLGTSWYVDSSSQEEIELGTLQHPYKAAAYPFKELLNEFRGSGTTMTVLFRENTVSYITEKVTVLAMEDLVLS